MKTITPEIRVELARRVLAQVENDPEHHRQSWWVNTTGSACGTTRCVGGWAIHIADEMGLLQHDEAEPGNEYYTAKELLFGEGQAVRARALFYHCTDDQAIELVRLIAEESPLAYDRYIDSQGIVVD